MATDAARAAGIDLSDPQLVSLDKILVIKRPPGDGHIVSQYFGKDSGNLKGGLFILENVLKGGATERNVLANSTCEKGAHSGKKLGGGSFLSPDLDYDGQSILFAYADSGESYHIYKVKPDGTGLVQLTEGKEDDFDPVFLPDGRIMFVSTRRGGFGRCHSTIKPTYTLFAMNADGSDIHAVSFHETNEWNPSVDNNGMIIYSRWDYVDRGSAYVHHGWITTPDGLDARAIGTNYPPIRQVSPTDWVILEVPNALLQLRAIPDSNKYVGTAVGHHSHAYGSLVMFDPDVEDDDGVAQYTRLTPDAKYPESEGCRDAGCDNKYATPWPLSENYFLCAYAPDGSKFGVYLIDAAGNKVALKAEGGPYLDPIPLVGRARPVVVAPGVLPTNPKDNVVVTVMNVYDSLYPWPDKREIKALRIVQIYPKTTQYANSPRLGHGGIDANEQNGRGVLGTVPVESDGSAHFLMPQGKPVYFQALDGDGVAIQSMMSDTYAVAQSSRLSCQGCHEPRHRSPHPPKTMPMAMLRSPTPIEADPAGSNPISFPILIQPILERKCSTNSCHSGGNNGRSFTKAVVGNDENKGKWFQSYASLQDQVSFYLSKEGDVGRPSPFTRKAQVMPTISLPGQINGAYASKLYPLLKGGHKGVQLTREELRSFALWLDNNSDFYGTTDDHDAQIQGKAVRPKIE